MLFTAGHVVGRDPAALERRQHRRQQRSDAPAQQGEQEAARTELLRAAAGGAAAKPSEAGKRDPFLPLVNEKKTGGPPLPPGKAGLVVATVRMDGTVHSPEGMIAVVSNPDQRVYFLREGDRLYDGDVEKIGLDGVTFKENSKDAFGKPVERVGDQANLPERRRAAMRIMRSAWGRTTFVAASLILSSGALRASDAPVVHVKAVVKDGNVNLEAQANAPFEYTTYRPSQSLYVLDLSGVSAGDSAGARVVPSELVKSYRVSTYSAGSKPMVRLEVLVRAGVEPRIERTGNDELHRSSPPVATPTALRRRLQRPRRCRSVTPIAAKASDTKLTLPSSIQAIDT